MRRYVWILCIYLSWITAHYIAAHLYIKYCTPASVVGFLLSPLIASTPHCEGFRWMISTGGSNVTAMWTIMGAWFTREIANAGDWIVRELQ